MIEDDPVAIIGIACRVPMGPDPASFWNLLSAGESAITEVPAERLDSITDESPARFGAFLDGVDRFDADFFDISPREAAAMDPQQRLALELSLGVDAGRRDLPRVAGGQRDRASSSARPVTTTPHCRPVWVRTRSPFPMTGRSDRIIANRVSY